MDMQRVVFLGFVVAFGGSALFIAAQLFRYLLVRLATPVSLRR